MKKTTVKRRITPGQEITTFSHVEVTRILFRAAYGKNPTDEQLQKYLNIHNRVAGDEYDVYLSLSLTERLEDDDS